MSCDYIIPPIFADFFSLSSVHGLLHNVLPAWIGWHQEVCNYQLEDEGPRDGLYRFQRNVPKLLPFLVVKYSVRYVAIRTFGCVRIRVHEGSYVSVTADAQLS